MKELNPQAKRIYEILSDSNWHCPREWGFADGHCKRITDINEYLNPQGLEVIGDICKCGHHTSKVKKRRIAALGLYQTQNPAPSKVIPTYTHTLDACPSFQVYKVHCGACRALKVEPQKLTQGLW